MNERRCEICGAPIPADDPFAEIETHNYGFEDVCEDCLNVVEALIESRMKGGQE